MRNISVILLAGVLLMVSPMSESMAAESKGKAQATKSAKKAKSRTLKELIAYAEKHGVNKKFNQIQIDDLGLDGHITTKKIAYVLSGKPEIHLRSLWIVYDESSVPLSLIWSEFRNTIDGENQTSERWQYKSSLTGKIQLCIHGTGDGNTASQSVVEIDEQVESTFNKLISFFLVDAVRLEPETKK